MGAVSKAYKAVDRYVQDRLRQWLRRKFQLPSRGTTRFPVPALYTQLGLIELEKRIANLPWVKAWTLVREPDAGDPHIWFD